MAKHVFSRNDIESLARRMEDRSWSRMFNDMPELQRDMRSSARILQLLIAAGLLDWDKPIEIDNGSSL